MLFLDLNFTSLNFNCVKKSSILNSTSLSFDEFCKKFPLHHTQFLALIIFILQDTSVTPHVSNSCNHALNLNIIKG
jgi:hypothetical protein